MLTLDRLIELGFEEGYSSAPWNSYYKGIFHFT